MRYYSTNGKVARCSFKEAVLKGLAEDGGLYMPGGLSFLSLPPEFLQDLPLISFAEIAYEIASIFVGQEIPGDTLYSIVKDAISFDAPLKPIAENIFSLELYHGPSLAFKDFGARFMARVMSYFASQNSLELTVLVATSGDTGSAVGHAFLNLPAIRVVLLYPSGKVSHIQEQQLTTLGGNIQALEVLGVFDDCQKLVKQAFLDKELQTRLALTSANSINIARLIPQIFYYFRAWALLPEKDRKLAISVPSGNFGNLTAGLLAKKMGLPVSKFIAATNMNRVIPDYLDRGEFVPRPSLPTLSNAMDVGNPSNFARMLDLYSHDVSYMREDIWGVSHCDDETRAVIQQVWRDHAYLLDPHGAVGYLGLKSFLAQKRENWNGIFLATAHPAKFADIVESATGTKVELPDALIQSLNKPKQATLIENDYLVFKNLLLNLFAK